MQVIILSDFSEVNGGAAKVAIESAKGLAEAGVNVVYICASGNLATELMHPNIRIIRLPLMNVWDTSNKFIAFKNLIWNKMAYRGIKKTLSDINLQNTVIHIHQWSKCFSPSAVYALAESGLPMIITMHDYFTYCPIGSYYNYKTNLPCSLHSMSLRCICTQCDRKNYLHKFARVVRQFVLNLALHKTKKLSFVHISEFAREFSIQHLSPKATNFLIPNAISAPNILAPADVAKNKHVLYLGRFSHEKGVLDIAKATFASNIPVRFVGEGELESEIRRINPNAEILPWVTTAQVYLQLKAARVLVAPSLWYETGPLVVREAAALGVPSVVYSKMGGASFLVDQQTGIIVHKGDVVELASALTSIMDDNYVSSMGSLAFNHYWQDPFTLEKNIQAHISAYKELLG